MDRGAWRATVHGVAKSWTTLSAYAHIPLAIIRRGFTLETLKFCKFKTKHWLQLLSAMKLFLTLPFSQHQALEW